MGIFKCKSARPLLLTGVLNINQTMDNSSDLLAKIRQQFDFGPYPLIPIAKSPKDDAEQLFIHNLVTPHYLRHQQVISTQDKLILDAGCGSGYKSLVLAQANPGAKIVGIDLSENSVHLAKERLDFHGFKNVEFHALLLEDLPRLGMQFDYINCDEVLYLLPDPVVGLERLKSVLKPTGILRTNLHSSLQRAGFYRAQEIFKLMGLMDANPEAMELELVQEIMKSLKDTVDLKSKAWNANFDHANAQEALLMNHLFQGDKGYTIPELFSYLQQADLELISMTNWRRWNLWELFKDPDNLPPFLAMSLPEISLEQQLSLFELFQPVHRLLDFWCGHPQADSEIIPLSEWQLEDWQKSIIHLHPQLCTAKAKEKFIDSIENQKPLDIFLLLAATAGKSTLFDSLIAALLLFLWQSPRSLPELLNHWLQLQPLHPISLKPFTPEAAQARLVKILIQLETFLYVLVEPQDRS
jgi:SAM-dependent methyltransferase